MRAFRRIDAGFTLVELLLVISLMGIVSSAIAVAFFTSARSLESAAKRLPGPQASQSLNSWLAADIESAGRTTIDTSAAKSSNCQIPEPVLAGDPNYSVNVIYTEAVDPRATLSPVTTYAASYRYYPNKKSLWRVFCVKKTPKASPTHFGMLVDGLSTVPTASPVPSAAPDSISIDITTVKKNTPYLFSLNGDVKAPAVLPVAGPGPGGGLPERPECQYTGWTQGPTPVFRLGHPGGSSGEFLEQNVVFRVKTNMSANSTCNSISLLFPAAGPDPALRVFMIRDSPVSDWWQGTLTQGVPPLGVADIDDRKWQRTPPKTYLFDVVDDYIAPVAPDPGSPGSTISYIGPALPGPLTLKIG